MSHRYFTLVRREGNQWTAESGDYSKGTVQEELEDAIGGYQDIRRKDLRIIQTSDDQASIDAAVADLNRRR